jgi:hypothetical protein
MPLYHTVLIVFLFLFPFVLFLILLWENNVDDIYGESVFHQSDLK